MGSRGPNGGCCLPLGVPIQVRRGTFVPLLRRPQTRRSQAAFGGTDRLLRFVFVLVSGHERHRLVPGITHSAGVPVPPCPLSSGTSVRIHWPYARRSRKV